jgi:hypothetical protein
MNNLHPPSVDGTLRGYVCENPNPKGKLKTVKHNKANYKAEKKIPSL